MLQLLFEKNSIVELRDQRFNHPHPRVQQKMDAVLLKAHDLPHNQIASIVGISENTLRTYLEDYRNGGIEELKKINFYKPISELSLVSETIKAHFEKSPPPTIKAAAAEIEKLTGVKRGLTQVSKFVKSMGMNRLKTGSVPAKADVEKQEIFKKEKLEPKLAEARKQKQVVYFLDASHFIHAPFLGFLWCFKRIFVKAPSGRKRFNVLGAINAITHELITVTNDAYINALSVCELIRLIAQQNIGVPITLILDNARYQKCIIVKELANSLGVELLYLPPYSPNLNLIERLWKFTKRHCLNSKYYSDFPSFCEAISSFLKNIHTDHESDLNSLLTHQFQKFDLTQLPYAY